MATVKTGCCGNTDKFLIGDTFGDGRVRVEGTCPICGAVDPRGTIVVDDEEDVPPRCSRHPGEELAAIPGGAVCPICWCTSCEQEHDPADTAICSRVDVWRRGIESDRAERKFEDECRIWP